MKRKPVERPGWLVLYSLQSVACWETLRAGGRYLAQPMACPDFWGHDEPVIQQAYGWLAGQMRSRGLLPPSGAPEQAWPVWAWHQWSGPTRRRPDLRTQAARGDGTRQVLLTLNVEASRVLLHDFDAWHAVLNYWYLGREPEGEAFDARCAAAGCSPYLHKPLPDASLHRELVASWDRIFDLAASRETMETAPDRQCVQATLWQILPTDVVQVVEFGGGRPRRVHQGLGVAAAVRQSPGPVGPEGAGPTSSRRVGACAATR